MLRCCLALALFCYLLTDPASAQNKHAFIVGIDKYDNLKADAQLRNAVGDAKAMAEALMSLGFGVTSAPNATRPEFNQRWQDFLIALKPGDTAAFVFSGHGVEIGGVNYLLPRDVPRIRYGRDELLKRESLSLQEILHDLKEKQTAFSLVIVDACRDNPFAEGGRTVGGARGLARVEPPQGTFIMFSAGAYQTALDRLDDNDKSPTSIYTRSLLPLLKTKNLSLLDMADRLGEQVSDLAAKVAHRQTPAFYSGVIGARRLCLAGCDLTPIATAIPPKLENKAAQTWRFIENLEDVSVFERFRAEFGATDPAHDQMAANRIAALRQAQDQKKEAAVKQQMALLQKQDNDRKKAVPDARTLSPGQKFRDCPDCPQMVVVPAGSFMMGSPPNEAARFDSEGPQRKVTIASQFAVGKFEVTFAEWEACVAGGGCAGNKQPDDGGWDKGKRPVINVSWDDAKEYVAWLSRKTGMTYRLLTEAEWEFVARAGTTTPFSTGRTITTDQANFNGNYTHSGSAKGVRRGKTVDVGSFRANAFGLHDMHGNVFEWVEDCWHDNYQGAPTDGSAWTTSCSGSDRRVVRGGSWDLYPDLLRSAFRDWHPRDVRYYGSGFRVGRTLTP